MNPNDAPPPTASLTLRPRLDLASGVVVAMGVDAAGEDLAQMVVAIRIARRVSAGLDGRGPPISIAFASAAFLNAERAAALDVQVRAAGLGPREVILEAEEGALAATGAGLAGLERLRARGWGVALRVDPACPLPIGSRVRALFTEMLVPHEAACGPFFALDGFDASPLGVRVRAAQACGVVVSAVGAGAPPAGELRARGFDRVETVRGREAARPYRIAALASSAESAASSFSSR